MKKFAVCSVFCAVALTLCAGVPGKVNGNRVNMRVKPRMDAAVACKVDKDTVLDIHAVHDNWLEVSAPDSVKVYISEAFVDNGKVTKSINMRSGMGTNTPSYGEIPAGTPVKLIDERSYGWVRIAPPENLHVYIAKMYVDFDEAALTAEKSAAKTEEAEKVEKTSDAEKVSAPAENTGAEAVPAPVTAENGNSENTVAPAVEKSTEAVAIPAAADDKK